MIFIAKHFILAFTLVFVIGAFFLLSQNTSVQQSVALATTIQPEPFTELYFEGHENLSKKTEVKNAQTFAFTIHNLEYKTTSYPYKVYVQDASGNKAEILKDIVILKHDEKKTIPVYYELLQPVKRAKVVVNLTKKQQQIHYWIEVASSSAGTN